MIFLVLSLNDFYVQTHWKCIFNYNAIARLFILSVPMLLSLLFISFLKMAGNIVVVLLTYSDLDC